MRVQMGEMDHLFKDVWLIVINFCLKNIPTIKMCCYATERIWFFYATKFREQLISFNSFAIQEKCSPSCFSGSHYAFFAVYSSFLDLRIFSFKFLAELPLTSRIRPKFHKLILTAKFKIVKYLEPMTGK